MADTSYQRGESTSRIGVGERRKSTYNTIVIGAGPAGLVAAHNLEDVLILDKKPRIKKAVRCIGLSVDTINRQGIKPDKSWARTAFHKIERVMPNDKVIGRFKESPIGYVVKKDSFEKFLIKKTEPEIILGQNVSDLSLSNNYWHVKTKEGNVFRSKYVIAADGFNSIVRKKVFPEAERSMELAFGLEYVLKFSKKIDPRVIRMYFDNNFFRKGYGWVFPKSDLSANIGVGGTNKELEKIMKNFLVRKIIKDYGKFRILTKDLGITSSKKYDFPFFRSNVFLTGDAAGLNDSLFRAGTNQAMMSAKIAAECIKENKPANYSKKIKNLPFAKLKNKKNSSVFYSLDNKTLGALGDLLENDGFSCLNRPIYLIRFLKNKIIRKNIIKIFHFFIVWNKTKKWLW